MGSYRLATGVLAAALALGIAGCQSTTAGKGTAGFRAEPTGRSGPSSSGINGWPVPSGSESASASASDSASASGSPSPSGSPSTSDQPTTPPTSNSPHKKPRTHRPEQPAAVAPPAAALHELSSRGFDQIGNHRTWYPGHTLNALVGVKHDSADGYFQFGFFFVNGRYIGRDTKEPSAVISYVSGTDRMVSLQYAIYADSDANCCPSGGKKTVRYLWNGQQLVPLDAIPPTSGTGRR